eukprot:SM000229S07521  [mRNA]  locus=s229:108486:111114:- [translate_table: standard]
MACAAAAALAAAAAASAVVAGPGRAAGTGRGLQSGAGRLDPRKRPLVRLVPGRPALRSPCAGAARAARSPASVAPPSHGLDYYELLGLDAAATPAEIKRAYRWLQKRCHPDVATGGLGHDMATLLNEAYSVLSDADSRSTYDQVRLTWLEHDDYTGKPLYSTWLGHPEEKQAAFVDEFSCIGCLQCALLADRTFKIENQGGRARAVSQWGDDETTINAAMAACPVDCIHWVPREQLPVLEYLTSKLPRMEVGLINHSGGGGRRMPEDVFSNADSFLKKREKQEQERSRHQETPAQRKARVAAASAIQTRAGGWWQHHGAQGGSSNWSADNVDGNQGPLIPLSWLTEEERLAGAAAAAAQASARLADNPVLPDDLRRLQEAAEKLRKQEVEGGRSRPLQATVDYWKPHKANSCYVPFADMAEATSHARASKTASPTTHVSSARSSPAAIASDMKSGAKLEAFLSMAPLLVAATAAIAVALTSNTEAAQSAPAVESILLPAEMTSGIYARSLQAAVVWYTLSAMVTHSIALLSGTMATETPKGNKGKSD